ncbi:RNA polymerase sigma factor RpoD like [Melia azedarach]|uniref:RNA polymerase sigma factor RpoD like n=1 Tax=Melia azedarach TaxID=155640 RepID=A0ACC1WPC7_MELAZ|nr:RNA polymerase sigma factor RpoD like [Melia azedarach]
MHPHQYSNMNNGYGEDSNSCCYFHPKEVVVGVCPLCLNERLVVLASKQERTRNHRSKVFSDKKQQQSSAATSINLPKIFAFGSLLNRFEFRHWKSDVSDEHDACSSQEDSFISIKFENNGVASWEKGTVSKVSLEHCNNMTWKNSSNSGNNGNNTVKQQENKSVIEHGKQRGGPLRWRKRIGHLLQLVRWKRSNSKGNVDGVKVMRKGWIRTLTKRGGPKNKGIL